jgi:hypothetical protein
MKFKYFRRPATPSRAFPGRHSIIQPLIPVCIHSKQEPKRDVTIWALIDSGADVSIFPKPIGERLGYTIDNGCDEQIVGINGTTLRCFLHDIILEVGGWHFETQAHFSETEASFPVLGQKGFFDLFRVTMDFSREEIELKNTQKPRKIESN